MSKYFLHEVITNNDINSFSNLFTSENIFFDIDLYKKLDLSYKCFLIKKNQSIVGGLIFNVNEETNSIIINEEIIYSGLILNSNDNTISKINVENFEIINFVVNEYFNKYNKIDVILDPSIKDVRPFLWYNYNDNKTENQYKLYNKFTSYLDISELVKNEKIYESKLFSNLLPIRRRTIKHGINSKGYVKFDNDKNYLLKNYKDTMSTQYNKEYMLNKISIINKMIEYFVFEKKNGFIANSFNEDGINNYSVFYAWDKNKAYYLYGSGNSKSNEDWKGSLIHWESFKELATNHNINQIDFEGVNSPNRGWFKLSFGGSLTNYFEISLNNFIYKQ